MKVELMVNLKVASGRVLSSGTIFSDAVEPIPDFIMKRLARGMARIIDNTPAAPVIKPKVFVPPVKEEPTQVSEEKEEEKNINDGDGEIPEPIKKVVMKKKITK